VRSFGDQLRSRARVVDLVAVGAVPVVLLALFQLPTSVKRGLVLDYTDPTLVTAYTAHFVHFSVPHLLVNIGSYVLIVPTAYALAVISREVPRFRVTFTTILIGLPVALSALNLALFRPRIGYGFSGLAMGLLALLALLFFDYLDSALTTAWCQRGDAPVVFFSEAMLISLVVQPRTRATLAIAAVTGLTAAVYAGVLVRRIYRRETTDVIQEWAKQPGFLELGLVATLLLVGFPFLAFPSNPAGDGTILNIYTHLLGFAVTFIAAYAVPVTDGPEGGSGTVADDREPIPTTGSHSDPPTDAGEDPTAEDTSIEGRT
jgi:hypothetical protein